MPLPQILNLTGALASGSDIPPRLFTHQLLHTIGKLPDQIIAHVQSVRVRPMIGELMHPIERHRWHFIPLAAGGVKQVNVPCNPALPAEAV